MNTQDAGQGSKIDSTTRKRFRPARTQYSARTTAGLSDGVTLALSITLAFIFGYALSARRVARTGLPWRRVIGIAFIADTLSIAVMEIVDNAVLVAIPGAMDAGLASLTFWLSLTFALAVAFVVTIPVNRWLIARGGGHAVVPHVSH